MDALRSSIPTAKQAIDLPEPHLFLLLKSRLTDSSSATHLSSHVPTVETLSGCMYTTRAPSLRPLGSQSAFIGKALVKAYSGKPVVQTATFLIRPSNKSQRRQFSTSPRTAIEYFPPPRDTKNISVTPPAWEHPGYSEQQMKEVGIAHRPTQSWQDRVARGMVGTLRWGADKAMGYHSEMEVQTAEKEGKKTYAMNERKWMIRFIFLETVAGTSQHRGKFMDMH